MASRLLGSLAQELKLAGDDRLEAGGAMAVQVGIWAVIPGWVTDLVYRRPDDAV